MKRRAAFKPTESSGDFTQTLIFPEGTTTNGRALINFKSGAFIPGVPIQICVARYPFKHFDPCWVSGGPDLGMLLYRLNCQFVNFLELDFYRVYFGLDCSDIFGDLNSLRRLIFMGIYNEKRHIWMGCIFNNGRNWNNHCVNHQHLLGLTSSDVCDFNNWLTCVCRSYCIRYAEYQNPISTACSPR